QLKGSLQKRYFEVVMTDTDDDNWGGVRGATNYRSPAELIQNLIDCTSKGGNFVLNVGPTASGEFPPEHKAILQVMGKWLATNGAAIYSTEPAPECDVSPQPGLKCYATKAGSNIYLEFVHWPDSGQPASITIHRKGFVDAGILDSSLSSVQVQPTATNDATVFSIAEPTEVDPYATVIRLTFKNEN
ncbi:MAG TPA: alpha-L-fucosidase, partial [Candidatus Acidoferrum sp.]|nr:alpha-L-fucosidase [Candidatus Acidoferrum sp.]